MEEMATPLNWHLGRAFAEEAKHRELFQQGEKSAGRTTKNSWWDVVINDSSDWRRNESLL